MFVPPAQLAIERAHAGVEEEERVIYHLDHLEQPSNHDYELADVPLNEVQPIASIQHQSSSSQASSQSNPSSFEVIKPVSSVDKSSMHVMEIDGLRKPTDQEEADRKSLRTATWISCFFLITTDILGPSSAPYSFSKLGYVPGTLVYMVFGILAFYTGVLLWKMYLKLDSRDAPVHTYSDLVGRIFGRRFRNATNVLQSIQLLFNVAVIILGNSQGLSQIANGKVCFVLLSVIWTLCGMLVGQIRALQNLRGLSNCAIFLNFTVIFITMAVVFYYPPNYQAAFTQNASVLAPIAPVAFVTNVPWTAQLIGVLNAVYSFGGAMIFVEIMSEMKNPKEFIKSLVCAESIIIVCYMVYGIVIYSRQGQFTINPANQGISNYGFQTATNVFNLVSALIAAGLYGNIGLKVIYQSVVVEVFDGPELTSSKGRALWTGMVLIYWATAFTICSAIPQLSNISGLVAAVCIQNFSYTFPLMMQLGLDWQESQQAWWRKCLSLKNMFHAILTLGSLACVILGSYSAISEIISASGKASGSPFTCASPI